MKRSKITGKTSDGYHTFDELYEHRHALFCYLIRNNTLKNTDAILNHFKGWDLLIAYTEDDDQISYHLPVKCRRLWRGHANEVIDNQWDGHTSKQVIRRLNRL